MGIGLCPELRASRIVSCPHSFWSTVSICSACTALGKHTSQVSAIFAAPSLAVSISHEKLGLENTLQKRPRSHRRTLATGPFLYIKLNLHGMHVCHDVQLCYRGACNPSESHQKGRKHSHKYKSSSSS